MEHMDTPVRKLILKNSHIIYSILFLNMKMSVLFHEVILLTFKKKKGKFS